MAPFGSYPTPDRLVANLYHACKGTLLHLQNYRLPFIMTPTSVSAQQEMCETKEGSRNRRTILSTLSENNYFLSISKRLSLTFLSVQTAEITVGVRILLFPLAIVQPFRTGDICLA